jgi:ligand-binding SRPBCC domain-containing protein
MLYSLDRTLFIPRPRHDVFAFFAQAENLEQITPASLKFRILSPQPITMRPGTLIDYQLRLHGIPLRWRTRIEAFEPNSFFIDSQLSGPYRRWIHRHDFTEVLGGTEMRDHVDYQLSFGPLGDLVHALFVRHSLQRIFDYRNQAILRLFSQ